MGGSARAEIYGEGGSGGDGEEEREEAEVVAVESKWTNISQMVALLFVTVAAEGGGAKEPLCQMDRRRRGPFH